MKLKIKKWFEDLRHFFLYRFNASYKKSIDDSKELCDIVIKEFNKELIHELVSGEIDNIPCKEGIIRYKRMKWYHKIFRRFEWLTGTLYTPPSNQCAGVYCGKCGHSHNVPHCKPSLWNKIVFQYKIRFDKEFKYQYNLETQIATMLSEEITKELNKEIIQKIYETQTLL